MRAGRTISIAAAAVVLVLALTVAVADAADDTAAGVETAPAPAPAHQPGVSGQLGRCLNKLVERATHSDTTVAKLRSAVAKFVGAIRDGKGIHDKFTKGEGADEVQARFADALKDIETSEGEDRAPKEVLIKVQDALSDMVRTWYESGTCKEMKDGFDLPLPTEKALAASEVEAAAVPEEERALEQVERSEAEEALGDVPGGGSDNHEAETVSEEHSEKEEPHREEPAHQGGAEHSGEAGDEEAVGADHETPEERAVAEAVTDGSSGAANAGGGEEAAAGVTGNEAEVGADERALKHKETVLAGDVQQLKKDEAEEEDRPKAEVSEEAAVAADKVTVDKDTEAVDLGKEQVAADKVAKDEAEDDAAATTADQADESVAATGVKAEKAEEEDDTVAAAKAEEAAVESCDIPVPDGENGFAFCDSKGCDFKSSLDDKRCHARVNTMARPDKVGA